MPIWTGDNQVACAACRKGMAAAATVCPWCGHVVGTPVDLSRDLRRSSDGTAAKPQPPRAAPSTSASPSVGPAPKPARERRSHDSPDHAIAHPDPPAPSAATAEVLDALRAQGLLDGAKYTTDSTYRARFDHLGALLAGIGGDPAIGFRCLMAGEKIGDIASGLEVFKLMRAVDRASWREYGDLRRGLDALRDKLPHKCTLAQVAATASGLLRDRTPVLLVRYLLLGSLAAMAIGLATGLLGHLMLKATPQVAADLKSSGLMDLVASGLGLLLAFPIRMANRLTPTVRDPRINPRSWWRLLPVAAGMFAAYQFAEYATISMLRDMPVSARHFGMFMKVTAGTQWLFAMPFVFYVVMLLRATSLMSWLSGDASELISGINEFLGNLGIPSVYWLAAAPVALLVALVARGLLHLLG